MTDHVACVAQSHERVIVARCATASCDLGVDMCDWTEENQRLVDQAGERGSALFGYPSPGGGEQDPGEHERDKFELVVVGGAAGYPVAAFIRLPAIAATATVVVALVWLLFATRFGIAVTAVHDDETVADLMGIDVRAFQVAAFALGSAIAGVGGGLYAHHFSFIEAQYFNISLSITIVLYVLLGGTQTVIGPLLGAAVFTLLAEMLRASANWRYVAFAAALIVLMALRPEGLVTGAQLRRLLGLARAQPRHAEVAAALPKEPSG